MLGETPPAAPLTGTARPTSTKAELASPFELMRLNVANAFGAGQPRFESRGALAMIAAQQNAAIAETSPA